MPKSTVTVEITTEQDVRLQERFGRGCSRETLVQRAIAEVLTLTEPWQKPEPKKRQPKAEPQTSLLDLPSNGADQVYDGKAGEGVQ